MQTETENEPRRPVPVWRSRWWLPIWCLFLGAVLAVVQLIRGNETDAAILAATFVVAAGGFYLAERSESMRGIGGPDGDERLEMIAVRSMANAGTAMAIAVVAAWIVDLASGNDGAGYSWLLGIGALAYLGSMEWMRRRF